MYQNDSIFINNFDTCFEARIINAFKIYADKSYYHYCDEDEKAFYPAKTISFIRCVEGKGVVYFDKGKLELVKDECVFLDFHSISKYRCNSDVWKYLWINFTCRETSKDFELNKVYSIPFFDSESNAFDKMLEYGNSENKNTGHINSLFLNYFYTVMVENAKYNNNSSQHYKTKTIDEMCGYINQKLFSKLTADDVAVFFNISERRLHQIFTKELGVSPKQYIIKKKMEESYKLIVQTSMPINTISELLCFSSPYHFSSRFKMTFSITPTELRKLDLPQP